MSGLRPEILQGLKRWSGVLEALPALALGLWLWRQGGIVAQLSGAVVIVLGLGWGWNAFRRLRFARAPNAPGVVEIDEARLSYLHPTRSGAMDLGDLERLARIDRQGRSLWHLRDSLGQSLYIPVDVAGGEAVFDAFAGLPGMDLGRLSGAAAPAPAGETLPQLGQSETVIWQRRADVAKAGLRVV